MGGGSWNDNDYLKVSTARSSTGKTAFDYSYSVNTGAVAPKVHATLDPTAMKGGIRESRDNDEHPDSVPVIVMLDVTGSMQEVPKLVQAALPKLMGILTRKSYLQDPQICFGAIGDANSDRFPFQVGQFESDIRIETDLTNLILEGGGGGNVTESYDLAFYFAARKTSTDAWEKRKRKGYMFITGDEAPYRTVTKRHIQQIFGDNIQADIPIEEIVKEAQEKYHIFYIKPAGSSYDNRKDIVDQWKKLLGDEYYIRLDDPSAICETIGVHIGMLEGTTDLDSATKDLEEIGTSKAIVKVAVDSLHRNIKSRTGVTKVATGSITKGKPSVDRL